MDAVQGQTLRSSKEVEATKLTLDSKITTRSIEGADDEAITVRLFDIYCAILS